MGQIADDLVNGRCCSECSTYFKEEHGFPVLCKDCYAEDLYQNRTKPTLPRATIKEL